MPETIILPTQTPYHHFIPTPTPFVSVLPTPPAPASLGIVETAPGDSWMLGPFVIAGLVIAVVVQMRRSRR